MTGSNQIFETTLRRPREPPTKNNIRETSASEYQKKVLRPSRKPTRLTWYKIGRSTSSAQDRRHQPRTTADGHIIIVQKKTPPTTMNNQQRQNREKAERGARPWRILVLLPSVDVTSVRITTTATTNNQPSPFPFFADGDLVITTRQAHHGQQEGGDGLGK